MKITNAMIRELGDNWPAPKVDWVAASPIMDEAFDATNEVVGSDISTSFAMKRWNWVYLAATGMIDPSEMEWFKAEGEAARKLVEQALEDQNCLIQNASMYFVTCQDERGKRQVYATSNKELARLYMLRVQRIFKLVAIPGYDRQLIHVEDRVVYTLSWA